jgi:membrane carboxypeptidase/penicillin-binding protein
MGYQQGEIPMTNVHGQEVAGATFPVPIWHEYMAAALWKRPSLDFLAPDAYPTFRPITHGDYGYLQYVSPPPASTTTTATTTTATTTTTSTTTTPSATTTPAHP